MIRDYETIARNQLEKIRSLNSKVEKLESEIREFKLLCRAYFASRSVARFSSNAKQAAEAVLKEAEFEKKILSELESFTRRDVAELPFKESPSTEQESQEDDLIAEIEDIVEGTYFHVSIYPASVIIIEKRGSNNSVVKQFTITRK